MQETFIKETFPTIFTTTKDQKETILTLFPRPMFPNESCRERNEK